MPGWLKEDTATTIKFGPFVDVSDGATLETGLSLGTTNFRLSKNGGNYAAKNSTTATTHDELGEYDVSLSATDTNTAGRLRIIYKSTAALVVWDEYMVLPANVYDSLVAGTDNLDINLAQLGGSTQSQADLKDFADAGYDPSSNEVRADLVAMRGSTQSAIDLTDFADAGYNPATNRITGIEGTKNTLDDLNDLTAAAVNAEVDTALTDIHLDHLLAVAGTTATIVNESFFAQLVSASTTATFSSYDNTTDSVEAIRNRGDAAWTTGAGTGLTALASGTAQGGTASTIQLAAGETFADDELNGNVVKITSGTGAGQSRFISDYTGATDTATVRPNWTTNPDATSVYEVVEGSMQAESLGAQAKLDVNAEADTALTDYDALVPADLPTNFAAMGISTGGVVNAVLAAGSTASLTYANTTIGTVTTNTDMRGTDSALLAASAPTNWSNMAMSTGGVVQSNLVTSASTGRDAFADSFLLRGLAATSTTGTRTVQAALRALRNRVKITGTTGTVYQENDTTPAWTFAATRASTATEPLVETNPV